MQELSLAPRPNLPPARCASDGQPMRLQIHDGRRSAADYEELEHRLETMLLSEIERLADRQTSPAHFDVAALARAFAATAFDPSEFGLDLEGEPSTVLAELHEALWTISARKLIILSAPGGWIELDEPAA
jgi:hypothetical protein